MKIPTTRNCVDEFHLYQVYTTLRVFCFVDDDGEKKGSRVHTVVFCVVWVILPEEKVVINPPRNEALIIVYTATL